VHLDGLREEAVDDVRLPLARDGELPRGPRTLCSKVSEVNASRDKEATLVASVP
jgi:hypothetical protein